MFGIASFGELPFATLTIAVPPPTPSDIPLGGHFGFDEKKRDKKWAQEQKLEAQRKRKLQEVLFGLPPEVREEITSAPQQTIEIAARKQIDYDSLMQRVKEIEIRIANEKTRIRLEREEHDIAILLELM
jgi:hypothetical protein